MTGEERMPGKFKTLKYVSLLFSFGMVGRSWDSYSDILLFYRFATGTQSTRECYEGGSHPKYATAIILPVITNFFFTAFKWWKGQKGLEKKLYSLPFLLAQLYPPFLAYQTIVLLVTRNTKFFEALKRYEDVSFIEPFVESIPQVFITIMIYFAAEFSEPKSINAGIIDTKCNLFVFTFLSSIFSASFGMAKLLQAGPCRMVKLDSYGLSFLLIYLSALSGLMARGMNLGIMVTGFNGIQDTMHEYSQSLLTLEGVSPMIPLWFCTCVLAPMIYQFGIFAWNQGIKRALKITRDFPALLLMPVFSNWAFGSLEKKSLVDCKSNPKLGVSFISTVINTIITLIGLISCQIWIRSSGTVMKNFFDSKSNFRNDILLRIDADNDATPNFDEGYTKIILIISLTMIISMIFVAIVFIIDSCCKCSSFCPNFCLPLTQRNSNTLGLSEKHDHDSVEMQALNKVQ